MSRTVYMGAIAHSSVPAMKSPIAVRKSPRAVNLLMRKAVTGIMMPLTSMNDVVTHWAALAVMLKYSMNAGNAVLSNV